MEIELNFRLDGDGRTANTNAEDRKNGNESEDQVDYSSNAVMTNLAPNDQNDDVHREWLDDLLFDAEIADCGLMPRTFWIPADDMKPRCNLEQMALDIFHHHVPSNVSYDPKTSGAEWWVQLRPSPEGTGRYSMHDDKPDAISKTGISFHWDKDEELRLLTGGSTYIHPHVSTVTYLTDFGSPTLVTNCRVHNLTGEWIVPGDGNSKDDAVEGFVSWPKTGKHMSFDGRYLHAAPPELMEPGAFAEQIQYQHSDDPKQQKLLKRRYRRVTFLVNIWLNYQPFEVKPFPDTMIDKLSGKEEANRKQLLLQPTSPSNITKVRPVSIGIESVKELNGSVIENDEPKKFTWPMGDCSSDEILQALMPLMTIREEAPLGGNVRITWEKSSDKKANSESCFRLFRSSQTSPDPDDPKTKRTSNGQDAEYDSSKRSRTES
jgi:hypothetical protein